MTKLTNWFFLNFGNFCLNTTLWKPPSLFYLYVYIIKNTKEKATNCVFTVFVSAFMSKSIELILLNLKIKFTFEHMRSTKSSTKSLETIWQEKPYLNIMEFKISDSW